MMQAQGSTRSLVTEDRSMYYRIDGQGRKRYLATNPELATAENITKAIQQLRRSLDVAPEPFQLVVSPELAQRLGLEPSQDGQCYRTQATMPRIQPSLYRGSERALAIGLYCVLGVAMAALVALAYLGLKSAGIVS